MLSMLKDYKGKLEINGMKFDNIDSAILYGKLRIDEHHSSNFHAGEDMTIKLFANERKASTEQIRANNEHIQKKITVKQYMTRKSTPEFTFMKQWNNDNPMPLRTMIGTVLEETRGMVKMKLHADITEERTQRCLCCGRTITNPVSQYFGMGPECGGHNYINPFYSEEELKKAVQDYRENVLKNIIWTGWIIKSAILEEEEINNE